MGASALPGSRITRSTWLASCCSSRAMSRALRRGVPGWVTSAYRSISPPRALSFAREPNSQTLASGPRMETTSRRMASRWESVIRMGASALRAVFYSEPLGAIARKSLRRGKDLPRSFAERIEKTDLSRCIEAVFMRDLVSQRAQFAPCIGIRDAGFFHGAQHQVVVFGRLAGEAGDFAESGAQETPGPS